MADLDLVESFFQSIDTIVNKRIEVLPYDKTIQATIEENDEADYGVYVVNDGQTTFKAFSENTSYPIGATVYVSIPKGDFNEQKIIIGQVTDEDGNATPIGYVDPMESFLDITGNIYENEINSYSLTANGDIKETETLWVWKANESNNPFVGFDILGLQADFISSVGRMQTILEGNYGLRLDVVAIKKSTQVFNKENKVYYSFKLDSDSFYGDPYNFETYYKQSIIFSLEDYEVDRIDAMRLVFYQDGNFIDGDHQLISSDINGDNLGVSNIVLKLGYNLNRYTEDTVLIYTFDPKTYVNQITDNIKQKYKNYNTEKMDQTSINNFIKEVNRKKIHCRWIHFDENNEITCYGQDGNTTAPEDVDIKWYRYHIVEQTSEKYDDPPGVFWEEVKTNANKFDLTFDPDFTEYHEIYKIVLWNPGEEGLKSKIENDDNYLEADRQCKALLNMHHNFDPLELIRRYCEDIKYTAWIINIAATQAKATLGAKESLTNIQTAYAAKDYDKVISTYNDILASSTADDQAIGICLIEKQTNFFKNWMTNFKTYQLRSTKSSVEIMNKIRADYQANQNFIEEKYIELGFFNIIDNDWATYCLPRIQSLMQSFINENPNQYTIASYNIDLSAYNIIMNQFERVLNEIKKDANTRNYTTLKTEFDRIGTKLKEQEENYYYRWFGTDENGDQANEPKVAWLNTFPAEQVKYEQVYIYGYCQTLYDKNDEIRNDIETTIRGEGAHILSNELEFLNEDPEVALVKLQTIKNLKLEVDVANDNGVYLFYNDDGSIINKSQASLNRKITAKYTTFLTGDSRIDTAEKIVWKFPKISTMIQPPAAGQEYSLYDEVEVTAATFPYGQYYTKNFYSEYTLATTYNSAETYFKRNNTEVTEDNDYIYITKYAPLRDKTEYGVEEASSTEISFRVKEFYVPSARNNTIYCEITKNNKNLMAESTLTFGVKGVIGTDYTFILQLEGNVDHVPFNGPAVNVITKLYDYEGKDISEKIGDIEFSWESQGTGGLTFTKNGQKAIITTVPGTTDITKCAHYILKAKITNGVVLHGKNEEQDVALPGINSEQNFWVKLTAYLPIVVERENFTHIESINGVNRVFTNSISRYEGATDITYDSTGVNPSYYKDPFNIWYWDNIDRQSRSFQNVDWSIIYGPDTYEGKQIDLRYYPWMNNTNALTVPSMYLENNGKQISVSAEINGVTVFIMPLHVYIRSYTSALLNSWNGGLTLDKENGTIMSAMMGAGYKDDVNRFYGILMGRMLQVNGERDLTNEYYTGTGLYGYHQGQKSFGLNVNGKAFFGKSGKGQILFDGNSGEIKSGNYATPPINGHPEGTRIDLDDGTIDIRGHYDDYYRTQASVFMSTGDNGKDYFCITSDIGTKLLKISPSDENDVGRYFLQSDNFHQEGDFGSGVKFDLSNGRLIGYDFSLTARQSSGEYAGSFIRLNSNGNPFLAIYREYYGDGEFLLQATNDSFILQSPNKNMIIDVGEGRIYADDFELSAGGLTLSSAPIISVQGGGCSFVADDSNVIIGSENLTLDAAKGTIVCSGSFNLQADNISLSSEGPNYALITSNDGAEFSVDDEGVSISGGGGGFINVTGNSGNIYFEGSGGTFEIDTENDYAIAVSGTDTFFVKWDGSVETSKIIADKGGQIGPFYFNSNSITSEEDGGFGDGGIYIGKQGISLGRWSGAGEAGFKVTSGGKLDCSQGTFTNCTINEKAKIDDATITNATIKDNIKINDATIKNGSISNATISNCTINKANIQEGTISGASISNGTITNATISQGSISNASISNLNVGGEGVQWSTVNYLKGVASQSATAIRGVGQVTKEKVDVSVKVSTGSYVEAENDETRYIEIPTYSGEGISATGTTSIPYSVPKYKSGSVTYSAETANQVVTNVEKNDSILALTKVTFNKGSGHFLCGSQGESTDSTN